MSGGYPSIVEWWPVTEDSWVPGRDGLRHFLPSGGGLVGACSAPLQSPPVVIFPDLDATCCPQCLRITFPALLPDLLRRMP